MENTVYIRMRNRVQVKSNDTVFLRDVAQIISRDNLHEKLECLPVHKVTTKDNNIIIIDVMMVIRLISKAFPTVDIQAIGPPQTIIEVMIKRKSVSIPLFILVWFLLFVGSAITIMNFHEDVSMQAVQQRIYTIITGKQEWKPLLFQIPYSFGLGLGMILFFNHFFKKRINEEPSPLEVEMFNYQQSLDQYVILKENKESVRRLDDD
ncbi:stage V sporulation protein AA [Mesobacillus maritimus]|uniref:stage V sporulation protein AA n=1 Tax=Mesobacillus maritimus TaxID=1643336 RepID=UPI00203B7556|nr:stage V sporulation protein AA [Mesobacillus maritimus]MCM3586446.1 stage V sporulation protein AA [Mesobacillus maritimus]MCM3669522.1 stage V sporulation protein AA [Mesobacillus maritimus]